MYLLTLTNKQEQGLREAVQRYKNGEKYVTISGYAGTGKSVLTKHIIEAIGVDESEVVYATYTGKAAQVLLNYGSKNAITLHKLLYKVNVKKNGIIEFVPKSSIEPYKVVVVDECSMMPMNMAKDLYVHDAFFILLGDPAQLPSIEPDQDNHLLDKPHVFLDEIMRQAKESEIIRLSMDIRAGKRIMPQLGKEVQVYNKKDFFDEMLPWADQVICAKNDTRKMLNMRMREMAGFTSEFPQEGDKVICLSNYWDTIGQNETPLVNGTIGKLTNIWDTFCYLPPQYGHRMIKLIGGKFTSDIDESFGSLLFDKNLFATGMPFHKNNGAMISALKRKKNFYFPHEFDFGYAITCHKAQGSSWPKVLVFEENFPAETDEHRRWLYTAVTRSKEKCVIIKKD